MSAKSSTLMIVLRASWFALAVALGGAALFVSFLLLDRAVSFETSGRGVLTSPVARAALVALWVGEGIGVVVGLGSLLLIRRRDLEERAVAGILARSIVATLLAGAGTLVLWLVVGHVVIGF